MALILKGIKKVISIPVTARFLDDNEQMVEHGFSASYRKLDKGKRHDLLRRLRELQVKLAAAVKAEDYESLEEVVEQLDRFKDATIGDMVVGWDLGDADGQPITFGKAHLNEVIEHQEYRDALWEGVETLQRGYAGLKAKNS